MNPTLLAGLRSLGIAVSFCAAALAQIPFTTGNLVLVRVGDGAAALTNAATPVFVEEYTPAGALVQSILLRAKEGGHVLSADEVRAVVSAHRAAATG